MRVRIATYNIWNSESADARFKQLIAELRAVAADVIGLQEVTPQFFADAHARLPEYPYHEFRRYDGEDEGLAVLSKHPIVGCEFLHGRENGSADALNVLIDVGDLRFSVTNAHLPWDSIKRREEQIVAIDRFVRARKADYFILLGDFNCDISSSVHGFLVGDRTLGGEEALPWLEISSTVAALRGEPLLPTLDCVGNPRWKGKNTIYEPENFDRIYILDNWKPMEFRDARLFGTEISPLTGLCASDHYGVVAEVEFIREVRE